MFIVSVRIGILVGRRIDRAVEARYSDDSKTIEPASAGQEEDRGD